VDPVPVGYRAGVGRQGRVPAERPCLECGVVHVLRLRWPATVVKGIPSAWPTWRQERHWPTASLRMFRTLSA